MTDVFSTFNETCELMRSQAALDAMGGPKESPFYVTDSRVPCRMIENTGGESRLHNAERTTAGGTAYLLPAVTVDETYRIRWRGRVLDITRVRAQRNMMGQVSWYACDWEEISGVG